MRQDLKKSVYLESNALNNNIYSLFIMVRHTKHKKRASSKHTRRQRRRHSSKRSHKMRGGMDLLSRGKALFSSVNPFAKKEEKPEDEAPMALGKPVEAAPTAPAQAPVASEPMAPPAEPMKPISGGRRRKYRRRGGYGKRTMKGRGCGSKHGKKHHSKTKKRGGRKYKKRGGGCGCGLV